MPPFIQGLELNRRFYHEIVRPLLVTHFPHIPHAAARLGDGSEVLGYDTPMSTDHDWGLKFQIFLPAEAMPHTEAMQTILTAHLPATFLGYPVGYHTSPLEAGTLVAGHGEHGNIAHQLTITTVHDFIHTQLAHDLNTPFTTADWLSTASQLFLSVTAGAVFQDDSGELTAVREKFAYYPHDVWLYLMAASWARLGEEEHLMPRAGYAGDELGSSLIGGRLVRDLMALAFLQARRYAPYPKWFGTAFKQLPIAAKVEPLLWQAQQATTWQARNEAIVAACVVLLEGHNALGVTPPLPTDIRQFFNRPFKVIFAGNVAEALIAAIDESSLRAFAQKGVIGGIDHISDHTFIRSHVGQWRVRSKALYAELDG